MTSPPLSDHGLLHAIGHEIVYLMGLTAPDQWPYLFWSGIGSDLTKFAIIIVGVRYLERQAASGNLLPPAPRRRRRKGSQS